MSLGALLEYIAFSTRNVWYEFRLSLKYTLIGACKVYIHALVHTLTVEPG